ncbi:MAG: AtpZ/AtpI family protein [Acidobacteriaceae bacterium]|nr:AtpZ/AtpI family protein [Acidobacteriaceae bacterium]MBV9779737.1 AtpZ/AtpI family protein [Acidobacteriaceae bacterium]
MPGRPDKSLIWFGKYLSLALTLPGCVIAGYLVGALLDCWLHIPFLRVLGILLGMLAGLLQVFRELARDEAKNKSG